MQLADSMLSESDSTDDSDIHVNRGMSIGTLALGRSWLGALVRGRLRVTGVRVTREVYYDVG